MTLKPQTKKILIITLVAAIAIGIVLYVMGVFNKKYFFDWSGGNKVAAKGDGKHYAGLHVPTGDVSGISVGDYVMIEGPAWIAGRRKVLMLGSDDGLYNQKSMIVVDVEDKPGAAGDATGSFRKA